MKKYIILGAAILTLGLTSTALAHHKEDHEQGPAPKITICHATSSAENPWVRIVVSENATGGHFDNNGTPKAGHEDDVLLQGDVACPVVEPVVDVCENIEGNQSETPEGFIRKDTICVREVVEEEPTVTNNNDVENTIPTPVETEETQVFPGK